MGLFSIFEGLFGKEKPLTQQDVINATKNKYHKYTDVDDKRLAAAMAKKEPKLFGYLSEYDPESPIPSDYAISTIEETKKKYPIYKDVDDMRLAQAMESKEPGMYKGLPARLETAVKERKEYREFAAKPPLEGLITKPLEQPTVGYKGTYDPATRFELAEQERGAEMLDYMKKVPSETTNKLLDTITGLNLTPTEEERLAITPMAGIRGAAKGVGIIGQEVATSGLVALNGAFKYLTGQELDIKPETIEKVREMKISPEIADATGQITAGLALLRGVLTAVMATGAPQKLGSALIRHPQIARFIVPSVTAGTTFGGAGAVREGIQQASRGELDLTQLGKVALADTALGVGFGAITGLPSSLIQVAGAGAYGFGTTYIATGDPLQSAINGSIWGLFSAISAKDIARAHKVGAFNTARQNVRLAMEAEARAKGYPEETVKDLTSIAEKAFIDKVQKFGGLEAKGVKDYDKVSKEIYGELQKALKKYEPKVKPAEQPAEQPVEPPVMPARPPQIAPEARKLVEPPIIPPPPVPVPIKAEKPPMRPEVKPPVVPEPTAPRKPELYLTKTVKGTLDKVGDDFVVETMAGAEIYRGKEQPETVKQAREIVDIAEFNRQQDVEMYKAEKTTGNIHTRIQQLGEKVSIKSMQLNGMGGEVEALRETLPKSVFRDIFNSVEPSGTNSIDIVADHLGMDANELLTALSEYKPTERPAPVLSYIDEARAIFEAEQEGYRPEMRSGIAAPIEKYGEKVYTVKEGESDFYDQQELFRTTGEDKYKQAIQKSKVFNSPLKVKFKKVGSIQLAKEKLNSPADIAWSFSHLKHEPKEHFMVMGVRDGKPVSTELVFIGRRSSASIDTYEPLKLLKSAKADSYYLIHNHPPGDVTPSRDDIATSQLFDKAYSNIGMKQLGHVIINDTKFGFIDKIADNFYPSITPVETPKDVAGELPIKKMYVEWLQQKGATKIKSSTELMEFVKNMQHDVKNDAAIIYLNAQNEIMSYEIVPPKKINAGNMAKTAVDVRADRVIPVNYNKSQNITKPFLISGNYNELRKGLGAYDIELLDALEFDNGKFISAEEMNLIVREKPVKYKIGEEKEMFEPEKKPVADRYKEFYALARQRGMSQPDARKYAMSRLAEQAKPAKVEPTEKPEQIEMGEKEGVKGFGAGRKGEQELLDTRKAKIEEFEKVEKLEPTTEPLKLFEKTKELIHKYAERIGEKYTGKVAVGKYFRATKNIFVNSMNNLSTVIHEVTHYIDDKVGFTDAIRRTVGTSKSGNPIYDPATKLERKLLTQLYVEYYGGKKNHKLEKRMLEGVATLIQKLAEQPKIINDKYPELVNMFLRKGGKYYNPIITDLLKDARDIIKQYQSIDPLQQVGARVINDERDIVKSSFLNFKEKLLREIVDNIYPIEKLAIGAGKQWTKDDPSLWMRLFNNLASIIGRNINSNKGYRNFVDGELKKLYDYNWKTLIDEVNKDKSTEDFSYYLVSRRVHFSYLKQDDLRAEAVEMTKIANETKDKNDIDNAKKAVKAYRELARVNKNDNIDRGKATQAYETNKERFKEYEKKFDNLVRADLDFLASKEVQLVNPDQYQDMIENEGYATFKRDVYNEIIDQPGSTALYGAGKTKVSSLKGRTGSELPIINPIYSSMKNHAEIIRKGLRQLVLNKIAELSDKFPDVFQKLPLERSYNPETEKVSYPQEKDPNIIMAREDYKRVPILTDESIIKVIDEVLNFKNIHLLEKIVISASRMFTKGTTGLYPQFTITNFMLDQFTATAQTVEQYKPVYDQLKLCLESLIDNDSKNAEYFKEYLALGGDRHTFVGWMDMSPRELFTAIEKENKGLGKVLNHIESGFDILAIPSKYSEIISRATEYIKSRNHGDPQIVALEKAGRVTAPFHHIGRWGGGSVGRTMIKSIPFFNASMEVLAQYGRTWHNPKTRNRAAFVLAALTAGMIGSMTYFIKKASDKQKDDYKQLYSAETANYIYFPHPDGKTILKFRIPEQMGVIGSMTNMVIADLLLDTKYNAEEYLDASVSWIPDQFNMTDPVRAFFAWWPQLIRPITEILMNVRTYPKRRPIEYQAMKAKEPQERYYDSTSKLAIKLGRILKLSPIKIDYLIEGYLGRFTRFFTGSGKKMNPLVRDVYLTSGRNLQRFYETRDDIYQKMNTYRANTDEYKGEELKNLLDMNGKIKYIDKLLSVYRKTKKLKDDKEDETKEVLELRTKILDAIDSL